ncbi:MAG: NAD(P)/FAD-dependent oxidoreductase, partial [Actinomycetota bacterium]|nr:NAD(P)/FAD-dependent oxidoreductase [Actinomycetota bacterium]
NRYPGARCDVPSMEYSYSFDDDLQQEWQWTEVMSAQPEILAYAQHVSERFDLRRDIQFETRVASATFDESTTTWMVVTEAGQTFTCRYCIMATGCLSVTNTPGIAGLDDFDGQLLHTGSWPREGVDLAGKRVGVIGTGSSGVQAIPVIAGQAAHLTVFQRTPVFTFPANNKPLRDDVQEAYKEFYPEVRERQRTSVAGFSAFNPVKAKKQGATATKPKTGGPRAARPDILDTTPEQRREMWEQQGFNSFNVYRDVYKDLDANELACEMYRDHVRSVVHDPETAEKLSPRDYPLGCKRQVIDTEYYEAFNRDTVDLVDLAADPLVSVTSSGVRTTAAEVELDVLVLATGFDAMTGALERIDISGRSGRKLKDKWEHGPRTYLGLQMEGFPNLFTITGPGSPSVLSNVIVSIEHHVEWISECIDHLRSEGHDTIEPTAEAEVEWGEHVTDVAQGTMYTAPSCSSWYLGSNIPGKPRTFYPYVGGLGRYRARCDEIVDNGYEGFVLA